MKPVLNEQMVLNKLGIEDFRHLTKDKVMEMASMLDRMDPEVAMKALDQFPNFAATMKDLARGYHEQLSQIARSNQESVKSCYATYDTIISACMKELEKPELTFEDKKFILERMTQVANMKREMDADNKRFNIYLAVICLISFFGAGGFLLTAIGGNTRVTDNMSQR